ncbi:LLM class flavin-dependent oxidoreductase [Bacillus halotolerans]|uniref:LLM class flavin-dependent oxidoreductase n=1 Tax=Bacillus halotolerans TaxID=260554 RepID=UPI00240FE8B7|nr:LLM class flavin-dependent oxidoreductase [Bacillus halotolerans]MDG3075462.1 LLM class flavin-dependent oxidoreductase [Bacillus halotolerans]
MIHLSILDQAPVSKGESPVTTLQHSVELAGRSEEWGYKRYWFAEHHSTKGLASTAPEIMIARIAAHTKKIRVGSGGVLLPQYSPFKVAETFRQLEALYPNRIDLGLGRSPGGTTKTRLALTDGIKKSLTDFNRQLQDVSYFLTDSLPAGHPYAGIKAAPLIDTAPELWVLGLGENSARRAAHQGIGYVFGHFINPERGESAFRVYRENFHPSAHFTSPAALFTIFVICAKTDEEAEELALSQDLWLLRVGKGLDSRVPSIEEAKAYHYTESDKNQIRENRKRMVIGSPSTVKQQLLELADRYETNEIMVLCNVFDFEAKKESYERLAGLFL